jgi:hypothetical protein
LWARGGGAHSNFMFMFSLRGTEEAGARMGFPGALGVVMLLGSFGWSSLSFGGVADGLRAWGKRMRRLGGGFLCLSSCSFLVREGERLREREGNKRLRERWLCFTLPPCCLSKARASRALPPKLIADGVCRLRVPRPLVSVSTPRATRCASAAVCAPSTARRAAAPAAVSPMSASATVRAHEYDV